MGQLNLSDVSPQQRPDELDDDVRFKWVPGYEGLYAVTDDGRVWSGRFEKFMQTNNNEHGHETIALVKESKNRDWWQVHRLVKYTFDGPIPEGAWVLHKNDVPADNRLENLYYGDEFDNARDRAENGSERFGTKRANAKLTDEKVIEARKKVDGGAKIEGVADELGVTYTAIQRAVVGETWTHVGGPIQSESRGYGEKHKQSKLTEDDVLYARNQYANTGKTMKDIAQELGVARTTVHSVVTGKSWTHVGGPIKD